MAATNELDVPSTRGYDWDRRAREIKQSRGKVCEHCGDHNGNYEYYPLGFDVHHIVKGRHLPKRAARSEINLTVVCSNCHSRLEDEPANLQFRATGHTEMAQTLEVLARGGTYTADEITPVVESDIFTVYGCLEAARQLKLAERDNYGRYTATPDALPYDAITLWEDTKCHRQTCDRHACVQKKGDYGGFWRPYCTEHGRYTTEEIAINDIPELVDDPRGDSDA